MSGLKPLLGSYLSSWQYHKLCFLISSCFGTTPDGAAANNNDAAPAYIGAAVTYSGAAATFMMNETKLILTQPLAENRAELGHTFL